jgi:hypothetical protein
VAHVLEEAIDALELSVVVLSHLLLAFASDLLADYIETLGPLLCLPALATATRLERVEKKILLFLSPRVVITRDLVNLLTCCASFIWPTVGAQPAIVLATLMTISYSSRKLTGFVAFHLRHTCSNTERASIQLAHIVHLCKYLLHPPQNCHRHCEANSQSNLQEKRNQDRYIFVRSCLQGSGAVIAHCALWVQGQTFALVNEIAY